MFEREREEREKKRVRVGKRRSRETERERVKKRMRVGERTYPRPIMRSSHEFQSHEGYIVTLTIYTGVWGDHFVEFGLHFLLHYTW